MPYIAHKDRGELAPQIDALAEKIVQMVINKGDDTSYFGLLNYAITSLILRTIPRKKYWIIAGVTGVLQNIITEFYRKYAAPYEEEKIAENGDLPW